MWRLCNRNRSEARWLKKLLIREDDLLDGLKEETAIDSTCLAILGLFLKNVSRTVF